MTKPDQLRRLAYLQAGVPGVENGVDKRSRENMRRNREAEL